MADRPVIRVRYCGGCNPEIERAQVVKEIESLMKAEASFAISSEADLLLLVNGCAHGCLDQESAESCGVRRLSVQGRRIDCRPVCEKDLATAAAARIRELLKRPQG